MNTTHSFWDDKEPCWEITGCGRYVREKCDAWIHPEKPCWEHQDTQCAVVLGTAKDCAGCKVFWRYGRKQPARPATGPASAR